jgi:sugar phosphate isomerase/epimerase
MSELTPCNYCSLKTIKRRAEKHGLKVTVIGGTVYAHPPDVTEPAKAEGDKYWTAWMMEITDYCVC